MHVAAVVPGVANRERHRLQAGPRRIRREGATRVRVDEWPIGMRGVHRRVVADVVGDRRGRHLVVEVVGAQLRGHAPVVRRPRHDPEVGGEDVGPGVRGRARQRKHRQLAVDRERLERGVVRPHAVGDEAGELRTPGQLAGAGDAEGLRLVGRPQRHPAAAGRRGGIIEAERTVPDQRVVVIVEPRTVVGDAHHVALIGPLGAEVEVVGSRRVRQRHLDIVAEAEARAPRQLADMFLGLERGRQLQLGGRVDGGADDPGVAPFYEVELRRLRHIRVERRLGILNRALRRVIERQRRAVGRVGRSRVDTVELRNPVPAAGDREAAGTLEQADVAPVAPADVVGGDPEQLSRLRPLVLVAGVGQQHAVAQVPKPLPPRRIAFLAAEAAADLKLAPGRFEQTAGVVSGCRRRCRRGRRRCRGGWRRLLTG